MFKFAFKLLMIFNFLLLISLPLWGNQITGLYDPPSRSVKFGRNNPYSVLPIGWSTDGNAAFLIHERNLSTASLLIINAVDDIVLYQSEEEAVSERGIGEHWAIHRESYSAKLSESGIVPDSDPVYGGSEFDNGNDSYTLFKESNALSGNRGIASLSLMIRSDAKGLKTLYSYVHNEDDGTILMDFSVLGFFKSPQERRIVAVSLEDRNGADGENKLSLRMNGAHLGLGFTRETNDRSKLVDAVLSGQFYMSRRILEEGGDPHIKAPGGEALILMAARQNNWDIVFLLLDYGAEAAIVDRKGRTLLHSAAQHGDEEVLIKLLSLGLNRDFADSENLLPYDLAEKAGYSHLLPLLRE